MAQPIRAAIKVHLSRLYFQFAFVFEVAVTDSGRVDVPITATLRL